MVGIEAKHALERSQRIALAREIDKDLAKSDQTREVVNIATNQSDNARQSTARATGAPIRADELDDRGVVARRGDENRLELANRARVVAGFCEQATESNAAFDLPLVDAEAGAIGSDRFENIVHCGVEIAHPLQNVGVSALAVLERNQNVARSGLVKRCNACFRGKQQEIDIRAAGRDEGFRIRARFIRPAKREERA